MIWDPYLHLVFRLLALVSPSFRGPFSSCPLLIHVWEATSASEVLTFWTWPHNSQTSCLSVLFTMGCAHRGWKIQVGQYIFYVPASYILYLSDFCRFLLCTCGWERKGRGELEKGRGLERGGQNVYCMGTLSVLTVPTQLVTHTVSVLTVPAIF